MLKIGHRGACGYAPENTLLSFDIALQLNVDMIELDVHVCRSGEIVVIHDSKVDRTTNGTGYVNERSLDELRILDAGKGEKVPTLQEALDLVNKKVKVNIELKGTDTAKPVFEILDKYIREFGWTYDDFLISSFNQDELKEFRSLVQRCNIGVLGIDFSARLTEFAERIDAYSLNIYMNSITKELIDDTHRKNRRVFVWTVNDTEDIQRIRSMGVDGIISNYPDRL